MSTEYDLADSLDVKGLSCPMPIIRAKQAVDELAPGEVLEVVATDPGSMPDVEGWATETAGVELLDQLEDTDGGETVYKHYVRRIE